MIYAKSPHARSQRCFKGGEGGRAIGKLPSVLLGVKGGGRVCQVRLGSRG